MYELDGVLEKGTNLQKKRCVGSVCLDPNNAINKAKIEMKCKNNVTMAYISITFEANMAMNHVNICNSFD